MKTRKIRTIVVDDENRIRRGIERLVVSCGEEFEIVASFNSGQECLQKANIPFDLLITDIKMPGMDGLELIKEMRMKADFEAIVISGFNDFKYLQGAIREGAVDYMVKPLMRKEFRSQMEKIKEKIQHKWEMEEEVNFQINHVKQIQRLSELTRGEDIDLSEMEWTKEFRSGNFILLFVSKDTDSGLKPVAPVAWINRMEDEIAKVLYGLYQGTKISYWYWKGDLSSYWLLLHSETEENIQELLLAEKLLSVLKYTIRTSGTITVSKMFEDLALLPNIRDQLLSLLPFRLIYGGNQIYTFALIEKHLLRHETNTKELDILVSKLLHALERLQREEAFLFLNQYLKELEKLVSPEEMERNIQSLSVQTVNLLLKNASGKDEVFLIQEGLQLTKRSSNFAGLKNNIKVWLQKVWTILERDNQQGTFDPVETAKNWIANHLGESLTIEKIAKIIHLNPTYFCECFKSQTGETVLDFVTRLRLEKAKELLVSTDLKIYDIAQQVGYSDTKYFSKLFKTYFGEVPSKFKDKAKFTS
ncbi:response regulator transcription factor [Neobacillus dielmonensis]|uniref:response regulator transcription factor n=1 Tax=Neobacillus dielmonensis TaxID=1347369 RepID=UPI0005A951D3|nr:helix-turn-helix domain-containing protein [Neobacillus dielmonensis]